MTEQPRGTTSQAVMSGAMVMLGTGPLTMGLVFFFGTTGGEGGANGLARLIQEGGGFSFAILALGALATVAAAVVMGLSIRRPGMASTFALVPFVLPMLVAMLGVVMGAKNIFDAIAMVNPLDKPVILIVGSGELAALLVQGLAFAAAGALSVAAASVLGLMAPGRGARAVSVVGSFVLGLTFVAALAQAREFHSGFTAVGSASPADRLTLFAGAVEGWAQLGQYANFLSLGVLLVAGIGATALSARGDRGAAIGVAAGLLVTLVGVRGFDSLATRKMFSALDDVPPPDQVSITLRGVAPRGYSAIRLPSMGPLKDQIAERMSRRDDEPLISFELTPEAQRASVVEALTLAHDAKGAVELVGQPPPVQALENLPKQFRIPARLLASLPVAVPVKVLYVDEVCEGCKVKATLSGDTLVAGDEKWEWKFIGEAYGLERYEPVEFDWADGSPEELAKAASIALANEHVLVVRVPPPAE